MYRHILLPTDGSPLSRRAVKEAAGLARACKAKITVLYVIEPYMPPAVAEALLPGTFAKDASVYLESARKAADAALSRVVKALAKSKVKCEGLSVTDPTPWRGIVAAARQLRCDLIVMASHGRKGLAGVLLGSETTKVLTHSKVPVLVCR
jgi:nucleotide-binding universal stress UspA family protein